MSVAALIRDGVVVNVAAYDPVTSAGWLAAVTPDFDEVRVVDEAGIGWTVEADGLRPPKPDGDFVWDEAVGGWVEA